ncbi:hypothetical protein GCM10028777_20190 [Angustibacter speluncae]
MRGRAVTVVVLVAVVALAGCTPGGSTGTGDPAPTTTTSPQDEVTALLTEMATSSDPDQCERLYTTRALQQSLGTADVAACREAVADVEPATDVEIDSVDVSGDVGTARLVFRDGDNAGMAQLVRAVRTDDGWRYDGYTGLEVVDRAAVDDRLRRVVQENGENLMPPDQLACVQGRLTALPDTDLVGSSAATTLQTTLVEGIRDCVGGGIDLTTILFLSSYQLVQAGLSQGQADCVAGLAIRDYGELSLEDIVTKPAARQRWLDGLVAAAEYGKDDVGADGSVCSGA